MAPLNTSRTTGRRHSDYTRLQSQSRAYQIEMFNLSCQQNIIIAMGTGTGKTQIALLRITEELSSGSPDKLIWLLCPTVALCEQHLISINRHIPPMCTRSFTGNDNLDRWKSKEIWDAAVSGVRVAVSTYQVLFDVLSHGFVRINSLSLLIFDEAHNCTKKSAGNKIMQQFYFPQKTAQPAQIPRILGLSASPTISGPSTLRTIEQNLDSICKSPTRHYSELMEFSNLPLFKIQRYSDDMINTVPDILRKLRDLVEATAHGGTEKKNMKPLLGLIAATETVNVQLGEWAATRYMGASIKHFKRRSRENAESQQYSDYQVDTAMDILSQLGALEPEGPLTENQQMSPKCLCLLRTLIPRYNEKFCGIVFVKEKSTVVALKSVIENYPPARGLFRCGTFVGLSNCWGSSPFDSVGHKQQAESLLNFRTGHLNLIIATNALEEGIDVPACNTVVSFNRPETLKSFIQRRGRARQKDSVFINIVGDTESEDALTKFQGREAELIQVYQDENRKEEDLEQRNEKYNGQYLRFRVERTGAQITMHESVSNLHNFCSSIPCRGHIANRPCFIYQSNHMGLVQATVLLPRNLDPSLHRISGSKWWSRKQLAKEDAALQAYIALFKARLVNDHLLPSQAEDLLGQSFPCQSCYEISPQYSPWVDAAGLWNNNSGLFCHQLRISRPGEGDTALLMVMPLCIPFEIRFPLFVRRGVIYTTIIEAGTAAIMQDISIARRVTRLILCSAFRRRLPPDRDDFLNMFVRDLDHTELERFLSENSGTVGLVDALKEEVPSSSLGLLRSTETVSRPRIIKSLPPPMHSGTVRTVQDLDTYPSSWRCNFLRAFPAERRAQVVTESSSTSPACKSLLGLEHFVIDRLSYQYAEVARFIPSINYEVGVYLVAERLRRDFFAGLSFQRMDLLATALRPSSTESQPIFRTLAFFGDSILRFIVSNQLFLHHPCWHEGLLSKLEDAILSDSALAHATVSSGLARFLVTERFNGKRWKPCFISDSTHGQLSRKDIGAATLSDMAKAIIGASYVSDGLGEASKCAPQISPMIKTWRESSLHDGDYMETRPQGIRFTAEWERLEDLLGHSFRDKSLLVEAMTHPSYIGSCQTTSYGRLAFLGSSVLDMVVVNHLHREYDDMAADRLQSLKAAVTNNRILTFLCMGLENECQRQDVCTDDKNNICITVKRYSQNMHDFLQFHDQDLSNQISSSIQWKDFRSLQKALQIDAKYPWIQLADFTPSSSPFSDMVQSCFGAIYIDTLGGLHNCQLLAQRLGIIPLLDSLIERKVATDHPKKILCALRPKAKISYHFLKDHIDDRMSQCRVLVDGSEVVIVKGSKRRAAMIVHAANAAAWHLSNMDSLGKDAGASNGGSTVFSLL